MAEASSPAHENTGFLAYNTLAGGVLTNKYYEGDPPAWDDLQLNPERARKTAQRPRGRHDDLSWGGTLYRYKSLLFSIATLRGGKP